MRPRDLVLLGLAAAILYIPFLGGRDLWHPNEPLFGQAVVEMDRAGSWLVPTVNGEVFPEKPILYFWLARCAALPFGVNEFTLRLPSAVAGAVGVLLVYLLVLPYTDRRRALVAAAVSGSTYVMFWTAGQVQMDLLLTVCSLGAILALSRRLDHAARPAAAWSLAGLALGLGFLAKGPVALVVAGMPVVLYAVLTRRWRTLLEPPALLGAGVFLAVASPWYVALWLTGNVDFLVEVLYRQNFARFVDAWDHASPWWYYGVNYWIDMLPWSLFVPAAVGMIPRTAGEGRLHKLSWCWIATVVVFFSMSMSKRSVYIMPAAPATAILVSGVLERWTAGGLDRFRQRFVLVVFWALGIVLIGGGVHLGLRVLPERPLLGTAGPVAVALLLVGGLAIVGGALLSRSRPVAAPLALAGFLGATYLAGAALLLPAFDSYKSWRPFGEAIRERAGEHLPVRSYRTWKWRAAYTYFSGREIPRLEDPDALREYWARDETVFLIVEAGRLEEVRSVLGELEPLEAMPLGSNFAYLFSNR